jgi:hypothetical protein
MMCELRVSDHAVLRYLERVGGFEIEKLRSEMEARAQKLVVPGAASVIIDGYRFVIRQGASGPVVVTILEKGDEATRQLGDAS